MSNGVLRVSSSSIHADGATFDIAGTTPGSGHDRLAVTGAATLGGTLRVRYTSGFTPTVGQTFDVLTATTRSGQFSTLDLPFGAQVSYLSNGVRITVNAVAVMGDMNCDGQVNVLDINPFVLALANPTEYANQFPGCNINTGTLTGMEA
ncbi:hypothetical protein RAS1_32300 [Phycisphaerae bacterium RAS1]|nr:hypothetical protein RAS1_32300 [Phycisphaerae bacterium RAS1]